jgi:lycopene beta-cyclase
MSDYDYIICGAGCAGLSLAHRLTDVVFKDKRILLLDKSPKTENDRTWSFWIDKSHRYDAIIHQQWDQINFYGDQNLYQLDISPYSYQSIRGIDFYKHTLEDIESCAHIEIRYEAVRDIAQSDRGRAKVSTTKKTYHGKMVFTSIVEQFPAEDFHFVWQHFKGWIIETEADGFDDRTATFMDFRIAQHGETRFCYVLPYAKNQALIEATIFSKERWEDTQYDPIIKSYISEYLNVASYKVIETEHGAIPMTTSRLNTMRPGAIIPIGTLNDSVKPSSGYAFVRIQEEADLIIEKLKRGSSLAVKRTGRFRWYDRTLLDVVIREKQSAKHIFSLMFQRNSPQAIFKFLGENSNLWEEIKIFWTLPFWPFLSSFWQSNVLKKTKK